MRRAIITVVGKDSIGIIAKVSIYLANNSVNICDISQTIHKGFFNMMMIVDLDKMEKEFDMLVHDLESLGEEINCVIKVQREEIFNMMHRV